MDQSQGSLAVPQYVLAPLLFPTLPDGDHLEALNPESPASIQQNAQRSIRCAESDGSFLYIGTSDGLIHSFQITHRLTASRSAAASPSKSQSPTYSHKSSRSISNNAKPIEKIVLLRPFKAAAVLCEGVVSFYSLPNWTPIRSLPSTRAVSTIVIDDEEAEHGTGTDAAGMISICLVRRKNIILGKIGAEGRSELLWATVKDIPLPGGAIFARRFADTLCIANATEYSLVNLSLGNITQLYLPISQTGESPSAQVRPSIVTVPVLPSSNKQGNPSPTLERSGSSSAPAKCEFLVTSHSGSITLGVFVKPSGEPAPKLLEWPSHPRSVTFDGKHLVSLLRNDTVEVHGLRADSVDKIQTLQLPPGLDPRFLQSIQGPSSSTQASAFAGAGGASSDTDDLDILKVTLSELDSSDVPTLHRASEKTTESSSPRHQIILCGKNSTSAVQQDPLLSYTNQQLQRGRLRNLQQSLETYRQSRTSPRDGYDTMRSSLESSVAHALLGIELLHRTDFSSATQTLRHANLDPRLILEIFPTLRLKSQQRREAIMPALVLSSLDKLKHRDQSTLQSIEGLIAANLTLNYSPPLQVDTDKALGQLKTDLVRRADVMLRTLLEEWRARSAAAASSAEGKDTPFWAGSFMDEQMLTNVDACVDSAYLQLIVERRGVLQDDGATSKDELAAFLSSRHACEPALIENMLEEKQFLGLLAEHHEHIGNVEGALKIWTGLVDGDMVDSLNTTVDSQATIAKVAALLNGQKDQNLLSTYGRWLVRKDSEAGIRILTKQTTVSPSEATEKPTPRTKAEELEAIHAQKATIEELRDIDADAAIKYLELVALSTSKVQDEQMHRELAAALLRRVGVHLQDHEYRRKMDAVASDYANGSYAESFFAHLALASSGSTKDMDRLKLAMLLQGSTVLDYKTLLDTITPLEQLSYEKAIILGKLGRDAEALSLLAIILRDANSAEAYCSQDGEVLSAMLASSIAEDHEALQPFAAMLSRTYTQRIKAHAKAASQRGLSGAQRKKELLKQLLSVYMANGAEEKFRIATAHLLNTQALHLDNREVLELVPKDWSLQTLETFLTQSLRRQLHRKREMQILRNIAKCRNLDVAEDLWARQRAMGGILQDTEYDGGSGGDRVAQAAADEEFSYGDLKEVETTYPTLAEKKQQRNDVASQDEHVTLSKEGYNIPPSSNIVHADVDDVNDLS